MTANTTHKQSGTRRRDLLKVSDVARRLAVTHRYVNLLIHDGDLEAVDLHKQGVGRPHHRIDPAVLEAWIEARTTRRAKQS